MAKAYLCADIVVTDREAYLKYRDQVPATIAAYGGRYLPRGGDPEMVEGAGPDSEFRSVILEFDSREKLLAWYNSPEYREVREIRFRSTRTNAVIMTGHDPDTDKF